MNLLMTCLRFPILGTFQSSEVQNGPLLRGLCCYCRDSQNETLRLYREEVDGAAT